MKPLLLYHGNFNNNAIGKWFPGIDAGLAARTRMRLLWDYSNLFNQANNDHSENDI